MMDKIRLTKRWDDAKKIMDVNDDSKKQKSSNFKMQKSSNSKKHMKTMSEKLPQLERQHKKAVRMVESIKAKNDEVVETSSSPNPKEDSAMDFMSPYDVPQTVYLTQPRGAGKKKKKKNKKNKKSLAGSSLLDSLAEF